MRKEPGPGRPVCSRPWSWLPPQQTPSFLACVPRVLLEAPQPATGAHTKCPGPFQPGLQHSASFAQLMHSSSQKQAFNECFLAARPCGECFSEAT